jgi:hypothetical protein
MCLNGTTVEDFYRVDYQTEKDMIRVMLVPCGTKMINPNNGDITVSIPKYDYDSIMRIEGYMGSDDCLRLKSGRKAIRLTKIEGGIESLKDILVE